VICRPLAGFFLAALAGLAAGPGCSSLGPPKLCGEIPEGGCPAGRGGSCTDRACAGLYDCVDGKWIELERCPPRSGDGGMDAGRGDAGSDGSCEPVVIDHQGEVTGCAPNLQNPDCPAALAEACSPAPCQTDCTDFFLCTKDGWTEVAYCDEQGQVVVSQ
jgi:hypothetical protein